MMAIVLMGKYAPFVWSAYGVGLGGLAVMTVLSWLGLRNAQRRLRRVEDQRVGVSQTGNNRIEGGRPSNSRPPASRQNRAP